LNHRPTAYEGVEGPPNNTHLRSRLGRSRQAAASSGVYGVARRENVAMRRLSSREKLTLWSDGFRRPIGLRRSVKTAPPSFAAVRLRTREENPAQAILRRLAIDLRSAASPKPLREGWSRPGLPLNLVSIQVHSTASPAITLRTPTLRRRKFRGNRAFIKVRASPRDSVINESWDQ
jgi:hypothetical protein